MIDVDLALIDQYDTLLGDVELYLTRTAKVDDVNTFHRLRSVPGIGKILALVMLYEIRCGSPITGLPSTQNLFVLWYKATSAWPRGSGQARRGRGPAPGH
jgi:hypothetical protein